MVILWKKRWRVKGEFSPIEILLYLKKIFLDRRRPLQLEKFKQLVHRLHNVLVLDLVQWKFKQHYNKLYKNQLIVGNIEKCTDYLMNDEYNYTDVP
jgi:hypothetical protein